MIIRISASVFRLGVKLARAVTMTTVTVANVRVTSRCDEARLRMTLGDWQSVLELSESQSLTGTQAETDLTRTYVPLPGNLRSSCARQ
jgi:allophanate hydrolase subunit 2